MSESTHAAELGSLFAACAVCGASDWEPGYRGPIRDGIFGRFAEGGVVAICRTCRVGKLAEHCCVTPAVYETDAYRAAMGQGLSVADFYAHADPLQRHQLELVLPMSIRGKVVADIGCGAGSFVDHIAQLAAEIVAIEPTGCYQQSLRERGYDVYGYTEKAVAARPASVDIAVAFQVIEHVEQPLQFLRSIGGLLKPGGLLVIATPNRNDVLLKLLPEAFSAFFYRVVHRWYFDQHSLRSCVERSLGFDLVSEGYFHSFGLSNAFRWATDRKPPGNTRLPGIDATADALWASYLVASGQADNLYLVARKRA